MDLSALIFVALAVAWAVYLIPKALRHHEEDTLNRSVDSFSVRMRVLARREAVSAAKAELVVPSRQPKSEAEDQVEPAEAEPAVPTVKAEPEQEPVVVASEPAVAPVSLTPLQQRLRRAAAARATARRRRVLGAILVLDLVVVALASASVLAWAWVAASAALLIGWLVACRLMVKKERNPARPAVVRKRRRTLADEVVAEEDSVADQHDETTEVAAVAEEAAEPVPGGWDPVPMTLPTYVAKAPAGRTVRTIDLESTGVWSSGRNAADSQLAREAEAVSESPADGAKGDRRASGA